MFYIFEVFFLSSRQPLVYIFYTILRTNLQSLRMNPTNYGGPEGQNTQSESIGVIGDSPNKNANTKTYIYRSSLVTLIMLGH